ncbi:hypothetical protein B0T18DRAFT_466778 [Schizothecium vesticola]|uniref:Uncharacterized protein n=1 Tax=Schizothecium vesticola TaxID=314040 RepID=A0AA40EX00_9PEZI|nr:hypothetical protein B0T18DRAFT_466778 [Schizothecium vesticola]
MVSWVSLLMTGHPQFEPQDDEGVGDGIPHRRMEFDSGAAADSMAGLEEMAVDPGVANVFDRLRHVLKRAGRAPSRFPTTRLHDLIYDGSEYRMYGLIDVNWILAVAMVSSAGTAPHAPFVARGCEVAASPELRNGIDAVEVVKGASPTMPYEGISSLIGMLSSAKRRSRR